MLFIDPGQSITPFSPATNYSSMEALRDTQLVFGYARVEGQNRFVINAPAYIPEGYITSGQVGAIGFGKITDSNGEPVTTVAGKLKAENIDVDNVRVAVAATFDGTAMSGGYSAGGSGWGLFQSGYFEAQNAWVRGRIEADTGYIASTLQIGGTSQNIGDVVQMAQDAAAGNSLFESWVKPGYTLIDGNKIFTGDAYVDTLQIAGNAVTVTAAAIGGVVSTSGRWATLCSTSYNHGFSGNVPGIIQVTLTGDAAGLSDMVEYSFRVFVNGAVVKSDSQKVEGYSSITRFYKVALPAGGYTIVLQGYSYGYGRVSSSGMAILGAKR
jgi:hypothetical protein